MSSPVKHALIVAFFGRFRDRFCEYQQPLSIREKLERAARVAGVEGVEIIYPDECPDAAEIRVTLARLSLQPAAINVNLKGHPDFQRGALSSPDPAVRKKALEFIQGAKRFAAAVGAPRVTCAPLADGYDYSFHVHYSSAWHTMVELLREAVAFEPSIPLHLEHKPAEPRVRGFLDTVDKVLCLLASVDRPGTGITFNAGHACCDGGYPAAAFAQVLAARIPYYIHFSDASDRWDWDLLAGSKHFWQFAEFLFLLKEERYQGWLTADTLPLRQDPAEFFAANIRLTNLLWNWLDQIDRGELLRAMANHEALPALKELEQCLPKPS
jgi:xylose isomerase